MCVITVGRNKKKTSRRQNELTMYMVILGKFSKLFYPDVVSCIIHIEVVSPLSPHTRTTEYQFKSSVIHDL